MPRYVQCRRTGKLIEVVKTRPRVPKAPAIVGDIEPFRSPVTGELITSRRDLRIHNAEHDVRQHQEYGDNNGEAYFSRADQERVNKLSGQTKEDRQDRLERIIPIVERNET